MNFTLVWRLAWQGCLVMALAVSPLPQVQAQTSGLQGSAMESVLHEGTNHEAVDHASHAHHQTADSGCHEANSGSTPDQSPGTSSPQSPDHRHGAPPCAHHCLAMGAVLPVAAWMAGVARGQAAFGERPNPMIGLVRDVDLRPPIG